MSVFHPAPACTVRELSQDYHTVCSHHQVAGGRETASHDEPVRERERALPGVEVLVVSDLSGGEGVQDVRASGEETDVHHLLASLLL